MNNRHATDTQQTDINNNEYNEYNENTIQKNIEIFDHWQSKQQLHKHKNVTKAIKVQLDKLTLNKVEEVKAAINHYLLAYSDEKYFYNNVWTLDTFLKQSNGYLNWVDEGKQWLDYSDKNQTKPKTQNTKKVEFDTLDYSEVM